MRQLSRARARAEITAMKRVVDKWRVCPGCGRELGFNPVPLEALDLVESIARVDTALKILKDVRSCDESWACLKVLRQLRESLNRELLDGYVSRGARPIRGRETEKRVREICGELLRAMGVDGMPARERRQNEEQMWEVNDAERI